MNQCFKIIHGTDYDKAIKKHFQQRPKWKNVMNKIGELLGESVSEIALDVDNLRLNTHNFKEENKKLFNKDGKLKSNVKKAKEVEGKYKKIILEEELSDFKDYGLINFTYGVIRLRGQNMESFLTSDNDIYYKTDFDLEERAKGFVEPITEIEYGEKYLEELKKSS